MVVGIGIDICIYFVQVEVLHIWGVKYQNLVM